MSDNSPLEPLKDLICSTLEAKNIKYNTLFVDEEDDKKNNSYCITVEPNQIGIFLWDKFNKKNAYIYLNQHKIRNLEAEGFDINHIEEHEPVHVVLESFEEFIWIMTHPITN